MSMLYLAQTANDARPGLAVGYIVAKVAMIALGATGLVKLVARKRSRSVPPPTYVAPHPYSGGYWTPPSWPPQVPPGAHAQNPHWAVASTPAEPAPLDHCHNAIQETLMYRYSDSIGDRRGAMPAQHWQQQPYPPAAPTPWGSPPSAGYGAAFEWPAPTPYADGSAWPAGGWPGAPESPRPARHRGARWRPSPQAWWHSLR